MSRHFLVGNPVNVGVWATEKLTLACGKALNMLLNDPSAANKSIIEASSGSTVTSLGMIARVLYNNDDTRAYVTNKTELNRIRQLQFFGLKVLGTFLKHVSM